MTGQERLLEEYKPEKDPVYTFVFTDTDGEKTTVSYYEYDSFYNKLINMTGQERLLEEYKPEKDPVYTFVFTDTDGEKTTVSYYEYDSSFYAAVKEDKVYLYAAVKEDKVYLVNKMNVRDLEKAYEEMISEE